MLVGYNLGVWLCLVCTYSHIYIYSVHQHSALSAIFMNLK